MVANRKDLSSRWLLEMTSSNPSCRLQREHHFAEVFAAFEIALRGAGFRQRECLVDHHFKLSIADQLQNLVELFEVFGLVLQVVGDREACRFATFAQYRGFIRDRSKCAPNGNQPTSWRECLQALLVDLAADHLEHDIRTAPVCFLHDLRQKIMLRNIDRHIGAEVPEPARFFFAAGGCDDFYVPVFGDLNGRGTYAAATTLNEQPLPGF